MNQELKEAYKRLSEVQFELLKAQFAFLSIQKELRDADLNEDVKENILSIINNYATK